MVRALSSHQCGPCSNPSVGAICELSLLLVLYFAPRGFFAPCTPVQSSFPQTQHFQIPIRQGMVDEERHRGCAAYHVIYLFIYLLLFFSYGAPVKWIAPSVVTMKCVFQITKITVCDVFVRLDIQEHLAVSCIQNMAMT